MKINKDLVDAVMMVSFIILVLIGTTDFENAITKDVTMGSIRAGNSRHGHTPWHTTETGSQRA